MGDQNVNEKANKVQLRNFTQHLFKDLNALEIMIKKGMIESGITRIGAEQELCLIDRSFRPAPLATKILEKLNDEHFTTELSLFNLELNLDPQEFKKDALSKMENQIKDCLGRLKEEVEKLDADFILVGILPTIRQSDLSLDSMTPIPRYFALNESISRLRGGNYEYRIQGVDELVVNHDTLMFESCNTSFQVHYQVSAEDFAAKYNWAQAITAPVLAVSTNSPFLFGKRLWRETRIALFQQAADTRTSSEHLREMESRVLFGDDWIQHSVLELFKEDAARFRVLMGADIEEDSMEALAAGKIPSLKALRLHNGTIYKWNRPCYGIMNGKPHLRIENRVLPSGPTVLDEMANTAFWLGLMHGMPKEYAKIHKKVDFDIVKTNFGRASRMGMGAMFRWVDDKVYSCQELIRQELLPIAREGLTLAGIKNKDIDKYLDVIGERVESGKSGSQWMVDSFLSLKKKGTREEAMVAITAAICKRQKTGKPVHKWRLAKMDEAGSWINRYWRIDQIMSKNVYTVNEDDLIDLVPNIMSWRKVRHVPVENENGELVGLITSSGLMQYYSTHAARKVENVAVGEIMEKDLKTITPETLTVDAISLIRKHKIGCLPVVKNGNQLVGLVTEQDFVNVADHFLQEYLQERGDIEGIEKRIKQK